MPVWGLDIQKVECANHACKCYRSSLEKLAANNPSYKGKGGLTEKMRKRLTSAARCAIEMRSHEPNKSKAARLLERDLLSGPLHCFGCHDKCSTDFCSTARDRQNQLNSNSNVSSSNPSYIPSTSSSAACADKGIFTENSGSSDDKKVVILI